MTLNEVMTQTADAIREKTGKSELIKPVDFAEEIKGITSGGGESGGNTSNWRYFDVSGLSNKLGIGEFGAMEVKFVLNEAALIVPSAFLAAMPVDNVTAFSIEMSRKTNMTGGWMTFKEAYTDTFIETLAGMGVFEITEAEFYDLNA